MMVVLPLITVGSGAHRCKRHGKPLRHVQEPWRTATNAELQLQMQDDRDYNYCLPSNKQQQIIAFANVCIHCAWGRCLVKSEGAMSMSTAFAIQFKRHVLSSLSRCT
eukprot:TRINITY_DN3523_c0_g1_i1.p2 TRINITY_DN3523_c0_g1~~TRINITY_DN3523_c0_g1_i1.p2  ORF type:complete len:107 (-),score=0.16 TRINITY_DN3523_c0_g1_i1:574-894(-)